MNKTWEKINQRACYTSIWSWSPMPCEKHGPRASVTTKTSAFGLGLCLLRPLGHVFYTAWETMIKSYNILQGHSWCVRHKNSAKPRWLSVDFYFIIISSTMVWRIRVNKSHWKYIAYIIYKWITVTSNSRAMLVIHDDVIKWRHFPRYWPFVRGIHRSPVKSPLKGQWRGALMFSLICV